MRHPVRISVGMALLGLAAGCDAWHACTLIGCANGLTVTFTKPVAFPYRVELDSPNEDKVVDCPSSSYCSPTQVFIPEFSPESVTIVVVSPSGTSTSTMTPTRTVSRPNGEHCGPVCTNAAVAVTPPGS
jgi:hypothetical protein